MQSFHTCICKRTPAALNDEEYDYVQGHGTVLHDIRKDVTSYTWLRYYDYFIGLSSIFSLV